MVVLQVAVLRPVALLLATRPVAVVTRPVELHPAAVHPAAIHPAVATRRKVLPVVVAIHRPAVVLPVVAIHHPAVDPPVAVIRRKARPAAAILRRVALPVVAILRKVPPVAVTLRKVVLPVAATPRKVARRAIRRLVVAQVTLRARTQVRPRPPRSRTRCCSLASVAAASSCYR